MSTSVSISLDPTGFTANERIASYETHNAFLMQTLELQKAFGLRAEPFQIFFLILMCTVHGYLRRPQGDSFLSGHEPVPPELCGHISRRRIAEVLDIPLETVRRHVIVLLQSGMVIETVRGKLQTPGGNLRRVSERGLSQRALSHIATLATRMVRSGVFVVTP